nr:stage II sporulation protein P [Piscibacillus salipiscarius]
MNKKFQINWSKLQKVKKHPFLLFQVFFICLILFVPIFSIKPFSEASTNFFRRLAQSNRRCFLFIFMTIDQPILDGLNDQHTEPLTLSSFAFPIFTNLPYQDTRLLFGHELPRFPNTNSTIAIAGEGTNMFSTVIETEPPDYMFDNQESDPQEEQPQVNVDDENILVYTTHNRESFLPHLPEGTSINTVYHETKNVMQLSKRFGDKLKAFGLNPYIDRTDYWKQLPPGGYGKSYDYSRNIVKEVMSKNNDMKYLIDIHRDAMPRSKTTAKINGKSVARLAFVVGGENKNHEKNLQFASKLHDLIESKYPGLSVALL